MTKKDYIKLARALHDAYPLSENVTPHQTWINVVTNVAKVLKDDNRNMDYDRFFKAVVNG